MVLTNAKTTLTGLPPVQFTSTPGIQSFINAWKIEGCKNAAEYNYEVKVVEPTFAPGGTLRFVTLCDDHVGNFSKLQWEWHAVQQPGEDKNKKRIELRRVRLVPPGGS